MIDQLQNMSSICVHPCMYACMYYCSHGIWKIIIAVYSMLHMYREKIWLLIVFSFLQCNLVLC